MGHHHDILNEVRPSIRALRKQTPGVWQGFADMSRAAMGPGELDVKTKELVALGIAIATQCDGCIAAHARGAANKGVTEAEVAEVVGVAMVMAGGPATIYGPRAMDAFLEFGGADNDPGVTTDE